MVVLIRRYWGVVWMLSLIALVPLSLLPQTAPPSTRIIGDVLTVDKLLHFIAYGGLALLPLILATDTRQIYLRVAIVTAHALLMEVVQTAIPGRLGSLGDIIADLAGVLCALMLAPYLKSILLNKLLVAEENTSCN
jgi:VanZ family protein